MLDKKDFLNSEFYKKYEKENPYYNDVILKYYFQEDIRSTRNLKTDDKTYDTYFNFNIKVMKDFFYLYYFNIDKKDDEAAYQMLTGSYINGKKRGGIYIDPDGKSPRLINNVLCYADGLISITRLIKKKNGKRISPEIVDEYEKYRKNPIIFFPSEKNYIGLNPKRYEIYDDKIDYALYDIKKYLSERNDIDIRLTQSYNAENTKKWLKNMTFENLCNEYKIIGIFVNEKYDIFNLEKGNGEVLNEDDYKNFVKADSFENQWSDKYLENLQEKILQFNNKVEN